MKYGSHGLILIIKRCFSGWSCTVRQYPYRREGRGTYGKTLLSSIELFLQTLKNAIHLAIGGVTL